jgi:pimeloyl-ACP methyl ester carboxylesterase
MAYVTEDAGGIELEVNHAGSGPPLLYLHGDRGLHHDECVEALAADFAVAAPLHPGWGELPAPDDFDRIGDVAELYLEYLRRRLQPAGEPIAVVGVSVGGWIAAHLAALAGSAVAALVLVSPLGLKLGARDERDFVDIYVADRQDIPEIMYGSAGADAPRLDQSPDDFLASARAEEGMARYAWQPYLHDPKLGRRLRRVTAPGLVVYGADDRLVTRPGYYADFAAEIGSGARTHRLEGAGHRVDEELPGEVAKLAAAFLSQPGEVA